MGASDNLNSTQNLVHPEWETIDPTPDIHGLFPMFDRKFFQGKLVCVQLEWSKKMYSCAGICYQRSNAMGKSCIIRLSEPLLKLRSRKDLVETLLHEMIHAYCFVLGIREGNGGHGPHFKKIMHGINKIAGTNITVYHTFHDEVNLYKTHWWKCNGVCRNRGPYYGMVKRTSNRKPGPYDMWWTEHQRSCGGEFIKVKEPEPKRKKVANKENNPELGGSQGKKTKNVATVPGNNRIFNYFNGSTPNSGGSQNYNGKKKPYSGTMANIGGGTVVVRKPPITKTVKKPQTEVEKPIGVVKKPTPVVPPGSNLKNVKQFKDLADSDSDSSPVKNPAVPLFLGTGHTLGGSSGGPSRVGQIGNARNSRLLAQFSPQQKKPRIETKQETIDLSDDTDYIFEEIDVEKIKQERQDAIKKEILDSFADDDMEDIILIDDEYDDDADNVGQLANLDDSLTDTSVIDELFSENDALIEEFNQTNARVKVEREEDEIVSCPMCLKKIKRSEVGAHLERCYSALLGDDDSEVQEVKPKVAFDPDLPSTSRAGVTKTSQTTKASQSKESEREAQKKILRECGYSDEDIANALANMTDDEEEEADGQQNNKQIKANESIESRLLNDVDEIDLTTIGEQCECPVCGRKVPFEQINQHLDGCLGA
ncbi:DNA-dependent metalloprotease SPRTN-like [Toxorhynchites rutilus septentrionalis]|uniref:DNA-dependent metalloprotease SPRTN-like n=1 Tax=Toxorhynchites rutilus septentrionalis TaxID=329112 RepID=UPI002478D725|nr:DNA-dependent metalloprotease SPRTN-like [Toxorhynchites rutilus septentrionalis]XP_055630075.1 DNA-dependent metalloprotease SPRTN-like [Toxorhynchites rutilus septentrionalis]XP_055630080.1 DNA-dependent metalloprotease SPRTN-like [Toxorhynchites rutilus septentrionalis]